MRNLFVGLSLSIGYASCTNECADIGNVILKYRHYCPTTILASVTSESADSPSAGSTAVGRYTYPPDWKHTLLSTAYSGDCPDQAIALDTAIIAAATSFYDGGALPAPDADLDEDTFATAAVTQASCVGNDANFIIGGFNASGAKGLEIAIDMATVPSNPFFAGRALLSIKRPAFRFFTGEMAVENLAPFCSRDLEVETAMESFIPTGYVGSQPTGFNQKMVVFGTPYVPDMMGGQQGVQKRKQESAKRKKATPGVREDTIDMPEMGDGVVIDLIKDILDHLGNPFDGIVADIIESFKLDYLEADVYTQLLIQNCISIGLKTFGAPIYESHSDFFTPSERATDAFLAECNASTGGPMKLYPVERQHDDGFMYYGVIFPVQAGVTYDGSAYKKAMKTSSILRYLLLVADNLTTTTTTTGTGGGTDDGSFAGASLGLVPLVMVLWVTFSSF